VGVAVKVTDAPVQVGLAPEVIAMATAGATDELTVTVMGLEVAVLGLAQEELEVNTAVTMLLLAREVEVKVLLLLPALLPFTFHW
jgi:hypothetical protein